MSENTSIQKKEEESLATDFLMTWLKWIALAAVIVLLGLFVWTAKASAQTTTETQVPVSACYTLEYAKGLKGEYKKLFQEKCKAEIAEARAGNAIGVAPENRSVTTVTYRDNTGKALEGSKGWAKHQENLAKIEVKLEKAKNPGCGLFGCYNPVPIGYNGDGYSSYGGGYISSGYNGGGYVHEYNSPR